MFSANEPLEILITASRAIRCGLTRKSATILQNVPQIMLRCWPRTATRRKLRKAVASAKISEYAQISLIFFSENLQSVLVMWLSFALYQFTASVLGGK
jgi:hypothetical protein